jgi:predicted phage terminase large subunit-like protein
MSTLKPVRVWKTNPPKKYKKRNDTTSGWYPTSGNIEFLRQSKLDPVTRAKWYRDLIMKARQDPNVFIELVMDNTWGIEKRQTFLKQSWFHEELQRLLNYGRKGHYNSSVVAKHKSILIAFPRGAGKTTQIIGRILWELGNNPNLRIKLVAETRQIAQQRVTEIRTHIEKNSYLHVIFPRLRAANKEEWTKSSLFIERAIISRDPTIIASGILASATGGRADILIGDDVVGRRNSLTQPRLREEVKSAWWSTWYPQLVKGGRCWYICTTWHKNDLAHEIATKKEFMSFIVKTGENHTTPWPERWTPEDLRDKEDTMGSTEYDRAYAQSASDSSDAPIEEIWIQYIDPEDISLDKVQFLWTFDLAAGKETGDFFAGVLLAIDFKIKRIYVVDYLNERAKFPEQIKILKKVADKWNPQWIVIEAVGMQDSVVEAIKSNETLKAYKSLISKFYPKESKRLRLQAVGPDIQNGNVMVCSNLTRDNKGLLIDQVVDFGIEEHDDISDALVQGILWAKRKLAIWKDNDINVRLI